MKIHSNKTPTKHQVIITETEFSCSEFAGFKVELNIVSVSFEEFILKTCLFKLFNTIKT